MVSATRLHAEFLLEIGPGLACTLSTGWGDPTVSSGSKSAAVGDVCHGLVKGRVRVVVKLSVCRSNLSDLRAWDRTASVPKSVPRGLVG